MEGIVTHTPDAARAAVDRHCVASLAVTILRLRRRDRKAQLADVTNDARRELLESAAVALFAADPTRHLPCVYLAADELRPLTSMSPASRRWFVEQLQNFLTTYRRALAGDRPDDRMRCGVMALEDLQQGEHS